MIFDHSTTGVPVPMTISITPTAGKQLVQTFLHVVWDGGALDRLGEFWTDDCVNHAAPPGHDRGLAALRAYHEAFLPLLAAFAPVRLDVVQQVAEAEAEPGAGGVRVVTHVVAHGTHGQAVLGAPATGRPVRLATIRIDRVVGGPDGRARIAEHWSVADMAGLVSQLQAP